MSIPESGSSRMAQREAALAGAIGAEKGMNLAGRDRQQQAGKDHPCRGAIGDVVQLEQGHRFHLFPGSAKSFA
jgi:hypothetical protein